MAEEIKIPCLFWPHRTNNASAYYDHLSMTNNAFQPQGIRLPNLKDCDILFEMSTPIPTNINAAPAGFIRVYWIPDVALGTLKLFWDIFISTQESTSQDPTSPFTISTNGTDTASGQYQEQVTNIDLVAQAANLVSNRIVKGRIQRKALTDAADTLEGAIIIPKILFVANT